MVESAGVTLCDPLGWTAPTPSMLTSVALLVCQVKVVDCPFSTVLGLAVSEAVGAAGGGGGGGGGGATFFLQAPSIMMAPSTNTNIIHLSFRCFTLSSVLLVRSDCDRAPGSGPERGTRLHLVRELTAITANMIP